MRAAAVLLLVLTSTAAAQPRDAGPSDASDAVAARDGDAMAASAPDSAELLAWKQRQIADLKASLAALDDTVAAVHALGAEVVIPPESVLGRIPLEVDAVADPDLVAEHILTLAAQRRAVAAAIDDKRAAEDALAATWTAATGDEPMTDQARLDQARLEAIGLERQILERQAALIAATRAYLERSQPARRAELAHTGALHRQLAEEKKRAEADRQQAEAARDRALSEQKQAASVAESLVSAELARLEDVSAKQAEFRKALVQHRQAHSAAGSQFDRFVATLDSSETPAASEAQIDARYVRVQAELERVLGLGLSALYELWQQPARAPRPARLPAEILALPEALAAQRQHILDRRAELADAAAELDRQYARMLWERAELYYRQIAATSRMRAELFPRVSDSLRHRLVGITTATADAMQIEAAELTAHVLYWLDRRRAQIAAAPQVLGDLSLLWTALWWFIEILLVLVLLRVALRRWDMWMTRAIEAVGTSLHLGGWDLFLARLAEFARSFGPPLLVLCSAVFVYSQLGGAAAPPEIQILYVFVFWMAAFRFQLRLITRVVRHVGTARAERASELGDDYGDATGATDDERREPRGAGQEPDQEPGQEPGQDPGPGQPAELDATMTAPWWELFARSWRVITGYLAVVVIILELIGLAVSEVVIYSVVRELAWWGALPLAIYCLHVWRPWIVREYVKRSARNSALSAITRRHSRRFYGSVVLALALAVVLFRQVGRFVQRNLSDLDATKRLLAFLFRRRVEKHAQEHGRVLDKPHDLPRDILDEFPTGPLDAGDRPVKPAFLDQVKDAFAIWQRDKMEGSVAVVGGCGMGKSTALRLLESTLGEPVAVIKITDKYTRPHDLIVALSERLALPGRQPASEAAFIAELRNHYARDDRRIIALDNCHNFFLRKVGGFAAWDAFKRIVNASCDRVFWVLSFNDAAWDYLSNIAGGVSYFRRIVHIPPWTDEDLRRMILTRMRRARYRLNFTDLLVTRLEGVKTSTQIIRTSQGYFRLLWDFTDGNPRVASHFWLRSLVPDIEKRRVKVHLFSAPRIQDLERLPDDIAFVLAAVVEHENITDDELTTVSNMAPEFCRFALQYCCEHGYMWRNPTTGRTKLTTHWQESIIRYLKRRHLLYT